MGYIKLLKAALISIYSMLTKDHKTTSFSSPDSAFYNFKLIVLEEETKNGAKRTKTVFPNIIINYLHHGFIM